jgi:hypothetical protein
MIPYSVTLLCACAAMPNMPSAAAATMCFFIFLFPGVVRMTRMPLDAARLRDGAALLKARTRPSRLRE